jgi:hypothetical protein
MGRTLQIIAPTSHVSAPTSRIAVGQDSKDLLAITWQALIPGAGNVPGERRNGNATMRFAMRTLTLSATAPMFLHKPSLKVDRVFHCPSKVFIVLVRQVAHLQELRLAHGWIVCAILEQPLAFKLEKEIVGRKRLGRTW